ncbi:MAG TPA: hypothetical protein PK390_00835 [Fervidobacterium nodosum]|nr:hypothetical protein [Fervidobacterium nodosum]
MKFESITLENQQCSNLIEKPYCVAKTDGKYVVISDLHIPYHLEKLVFQIAKTHKY